MGRTVISKQDVQRLKRSYLKSIRTVRKHGSGPASDQPESIPSEEQEEAPDALHLDDSPHANLPQEAPAVSVEADKYTDRLLKYIPAEVISLYLALDAIIRPTGQDNQWLHWGIFLFGILGTFLYMKRITKVEKITQIGISIGAYIVWVLALGGPFVYLNLPPLLGGIILPMYTFLIPLIEPEYTETERKERDVSPE